ncbi:MAG: hypothetical protein OXN94_07695 [Chloroflexota bacterium]|nr:hypothetical protein [Chloroflexota bacterium]
MKTLQLDPTVRGLVTGCHDDGDGGVLDFAGKLGRFYKEVIK